MSETLTPTDQSRRKGQATCRSCGAEIEWAVTPNGKRIPVDRIPVDDGNLLLAMRWQQPPLAIVQDAKEIYLLRKQAEATNQIHALFKSHFATCPQSNQWRKNKPVPKVNNDSTESRQPK